MVNPIEHSKTREGVTKYKVEPYVIPADVYGQGNLAGRGGWTWYTGSSSWMYIAGIKYILGLNIEGGYISFKPSVPSSWKEYSIKFRFYDSVYNVKVFNLNEKSSSVERVLVNGSLVENGRIKLDDSGGIFEVEVYM